MNRVALLLSGAILSLGSGPWFLSPSKNHSPAIGHSIFCIIGFSLSLYCNISIAIQSCSTISYLSISGATPFLSLCSQQNSLQELPCLLSHFLFPIVSTWASVLSVLLRLLLSRSLMTLLLNLMASSLFLSYWCISSFQHRGPLLATVYSLAFWDLSLSWFSFASLGVPLLPLWGSIHLYETSEYGRVPWLYSGPQVSLTHCPRPHTPRKFIQALALDSVYMLMNLVSFFPTTL